jgi:hypothetical protein
MGVYRSGGGRRGGGRRRGVNGGERGSQREGGKKLKEVMKKVRCSGIWKSRKKKRQVAQNWEEEIEKGVAMKGVKMEKPQSEKKEGMFRNGKLGS